MRRRRWRVFWWLDYRSGRWWLLLALAVGLLACGGTAAVTPTAVPVRAVMAVASATPEVPTATVMPTATSSPVPTVMPTATSSSTPAPTRGVPPNVTAVATGVWRCPEDLQGAVYLGSIKSDKYHALSCTQGQQIKAENRICFLDEESAVAFEYERCGSCW